MSVLKKLESEIFPKAVKEGKFGADKVKFIKFKQYTQISGEDNFRSKVYFGNVIMETKQGEICTQSVVIKTQPERFFENEESQDSKDNIMMFKNEFLFYTEILPLLEECDSTGTVTKIFPKLFYGSVTDRNDHTDDILIFENVQTLGFKLAESRTFLDCNHIKLTLEWLGKFHALSLVCKRKFPRKFERICSRILEFEFTEERVTSEWSAFNVENCKRGILPLQNDPNYRDKLKDLLAVAEEASLSAAKIVAPVEPLAVICHGDFCRNNIFYKYNSDGIPYELIFFDLATIRYSSPIIDFSFFWFMHVSPEIIHDHWDDILRTYHESLTFSPDLDPTDVASMDDIIVDFRRRGFYGYYHSSYWFPEMNQEKGAEEENHWWNRTVEDQIKFSVSVGGEQATGFLLEMVKHMIEKNFDFKYIKNLKWKPQTSNFGD